MIQRLALVALMMSAPSYGEPTKPETPPANAAKPATAPTNAPTGNLVASGTGSGPKRAGVLGNFYFGPVAAAGVPQGLQFGLDSRFLKGFGATLSYGTYTHKPADTSKVKNAEATLATLEAQGLWFPWDGVFYTGLGLGRRTIELKAENNAKIKSSGTETPINLSAEATVESIFIGYHLGWIKTFDSGLNIGGGLGLHAPLQSSAKVDANYEDNAALNAALKETDAYKGFESDIEDAGKQAGRLALPYIEIIRVGFLF
jgi:hypothetical protein